jgi:hypothetical protein
MVSHSQGLAREQPLKGLEQNQEHPSKTKWTRTQCTKQGEDVHFAPIVAM